ncbi:T9SS type A sorting domain-containing protein [Bacteroidota bacterium]
MKKIALLIVIVCFPFLVFSQNTEQKVIASAGGYFENASGSISWTLGELVITTVSTPNTILTQGFQQSGFEIKSAIDNKFISDLDVNLYPNPARDFINVSINTDEQLRLRIEVIDVSNRLLINRNEYSNKFRLSLKGFSPGMYFLRITNDKGQFLGSYKISKFGFTQR